MATPTATVRDYCTLLAKSKLLPADEVEGLSKRWRDETRAADDRARSRRRRRRHADSGTNGVRGAPLGGRRHDLLRCQKTYVSTPSGIGST